MSLWRCCCCCILVPKYLTKDCPVGTCFFRLFVWWFDCQGYAKTTERISQNCLFDSPGDNAFCWQILGTNIYEWVQFLYGSIGSEGTVSLLLPAVSYSTSAWYFLTCAHKCFHQYAGFFFYRRGFGTIISPVHKRCALKVPTQSQAGVGRCCDKWSKG